MIDVRFILNEQCIEKRPMTVVPRVGEVIVLNGTYFKATQIIWFPGEKTFVEVRVRSSVRGKART